jgi:hypothetical protein
MSLRRRHVATEAISLCYCSRRTIMPFANIKVSQAALSGAQMAEIEGAVPGSRKLPGMTVNGSGWDRSAAGLGLGRRL